MTTPTTVYSGYTTNWPAVVLSVVGVIPLLVLALAGSADDPIVWVSGALILLAVAVTVVWSTSLRVTVGPRGVSVRFGVFGWPHLSYPIERIASVEPATLSPLSTGWGIWWSRRDGLRLTLRKGPVIRLTLVSGRRVTINVEQPDAAVATLRAALQHQRSAG